MLNEGQVKDVVKQLFLAINYLHQNKTVHRDLKPENILFENEEDFSIKLVDFGFAKILENGERMEQDCGSPLYKAPEIILREQYGEKVDVWSCGVITSALLTGCLPFIAESEAEICQLIVNEEPDMSREQWKRIRDVAKDFVRECLVKDPT